MKPYCYQCNSTISRVAIKKIKLEKASFDTLDGVVYSCPNCGYIFSVAIDPSQYIDGISKQVAQILKADLSE